MSKEVMQSEWMRISTFANFPLKSPVNTLKLAAAGFYYQNKFDEVTCFSCGRKYSGWKTGDDPMRIHRNISPHCRFITEGQSGNIAVGGGDGRQFVLKSSSGEQSGPTSYEPLGISTQRPVYPHYALTVVRTTSFRCWPKDKKQHPQDLAKAGFFYEGREDQVRCFFCGGGLFNWDPEDVPIVEHARWYPKCVFLRQLKGDDFILQIQKTFQQGDDVSIVTYINILFWLLPYSKESEKQRETDVMSHPAILSVIEMGIDVDMVKKALPSVESSTLSAENLLLKVWELEDTKEAAEPEAKTHEDRVEITNAEEMTNANQVSAEMHEPLETIIEENKYLKDRQLCKICLDNDVSIVFLPCGHLVSCVDCSHAIRKCPICRVFVKGTLKSILS
ncbi:hypothetical protein KUTeg_005731 [Tegillarca granosa]|uniref:RING-type domain-containing protein n=1 Tax=Tegillarca granosa TaxID=220873 RepID=A0ABQ9FHD9_TEGGR|nr:hypothetical protein KUTeg_011363 [Tegillarca granosa]KAJ8316717.1 hypothetical protein KUTeg_005731 [Tegillarca granosa]